MAGKVDSPPKRTRREGDAKDDGSKKRRRSGNGKAAADKEEGGADGASVALPMGKALASTEKSVRDGAVRSLAKYLSQSDAEPLSDLEMARLWKGLFYCFWMSDKPRVQQSLAQEMADIALAIEGSDRDNDGAIHFLEGFFDAMVREWWGLDKWRVDKFMMLVRRFVNASFRLLGQRGWEEGSVLRFTSILTKQGGVLDANNVKTPHGLLYHLCDVYLEELEKACQTVNDENVPAVALLEPFLVTAASCHARLHYERVMKAVVNPFLNDCLKAERAIARAGEKDFSRCQYPTLFEKANSPPDALRKAVFAALFNKASQPTSAESRRRQLYKLAKDEQDRLDDED